MIVTLIDKLYMTDTYTRWQWDTRIYQEMIVTLIDKLYMTDTSTRWQWGTLIYQEIYSYTNRQVIHARHIH